MTTSKATQLNGRNDLERYRDLANICQNSWWESDLINRQILFSDYIVRLLDLDFNILNFEDYLMMIREDYRKYIEEDFFDFSFDKKKFYTRSYPLITKRGEVWVNTKYNYSIDDGVHKGSFGTMSVVEDTSIKQQINTLNDSSKLLKSINRVAMSLLDFLKEKQEKDVIVNILKNLLDFYKVSNTYLVEFTDNDEYHQCVQYISNVESNHTTNSLMRVKSDVMKWLTQTIKNNQPIVLDSISQLPPEAHTEYTLFEQRGICSMMVIPLANHNKVWGYVGMYTIGFKRQWSNEDYIGILSLSNIMGLCIELNREKQYNEEGQMYKENLIKNMPIGYTRFKLLFDSDHQLKDYILIEVNMSSSLLFGKKGEEVGGLGSHIHTNDLFETNKKYLMSVLTEGKHIDNNLLTPSGRYCRRIAFKWCTDEVVELNLDITETLKANEIAQRNSELFRNVFVNMPIGAALYDSNGKLTDMNKSFMNIFGISSIEDAKEYSFFTDKNMTDKVKEHILSDDKQVFSLEYNFDKVNDYKTERHGSAQLNFELMKLSMEKEEGYIIICIEDTDRIVAINKVKDFENFFSMISEFAKIGYAKINLVNKDGYAIRQWYSNLGEDKDTPLKDIIGIFGHLHPDDRNKLIAFLEEAKKGKSKHFSSEIRVLRKGTTNKWKWIYHSVLLSNYAPQKGIIEITGINYDITSMKKIERELTEARNEAQKMDRQKSYFLANMSHEIRTPLNAIVGFADLIANEEDKEECKRYHEIIQNNSDLLLNLINDILDLSKIEAGTIDFLYEEIDINKLCEHIVSVMQLKVSDKVQIIYHPSDESCFIQTDVTRLSQIINNLFNNAIKFTQQGSITLEYKSVSKELIRFAVTDTGIGIDKKNKKKIFDRFTKLNHFIQGTGLGLSICHSIITQMNGEIGVDSEVGKGSSFWFIIPKKHIN